MIDIKSINYILFSLGEQRLKRSKIAFINRGFLYGIFSLSGNLLYHLELRFMAPQNLRVKVEFYLILLTIGWFGKLIDNFK